MNMFVKGESSNLITMHRHTRIQTNIENKKKNKTFRYPVFDTLHKIFVRFPLALSQRNKKTAHTRYVSKINCLHAPDIVSSSRTTRRFYCSHEIASHSYSNTLATSDFKFFILIFFTSVLSVEMM